MRDSKLKGAMKKTKEKSLRNFFKSAKYIQESYEDDKYNLLDKYNELGYRDAAIIADSVVQESPKRVKSISTSKKETSTIIMILHGLEIRWSMPINYPDC